MEKFKLDKDIKLICVKADSFPDGIRAAQEKLQLIPKAKGKRNYFGVSYLYDDEILYMAATEILENEEIPTSCETYTLKKGNYISIYLSNFADDITRVGNASKELLEDPGIDQNGCCVECYLPENCDFGTAKDIRCMVRLAD